NDYGYLTNTQTIDLNESFKNKSVPIGTVGFSSWKESPWTLNLYPRDYEVVTVVSIDKEGRSNYHNRVTIKTKDESIVIPIDNSKYIEKYPKSSFMFNPRLYLGVDTGIMAARLSGNDVDSIGEVTPNLHVSLISHGKTKLDTEWTFLGIGAGYETQNKSMAFMLSPINYNIGKPLPLVENIF